MLTADLLFAVLISGYMKGLDEMRALVTTLIMVLILLACWGGFLVYTDNTSAVLSEHMGDVYDCAADSDWEGALRACDDFLEKWDSNSKVYAIYMEGVCVHDIELSAKRCRGYILSEDAPLVMGESASILAHISLMRDSDRVSLRNVL